MITGSPSDSNKFDFVCYGEILWDILPSGAKPGGAPMNVAYHLKMLGHQPLVITRTGNDDLGIELRSILTSKNISTEYVQTDPSIPTGIVHATPNELGEISYDIVAPAAWDNISWTDSFQKLFDADNYLVFGSLICRNANSRNTLFALLELAKNKVLDINLRPPHYSQPLIKDLLSKTGMVKLNRSELDLISGWTGNYKKTTDQINHLQDVFDISKIIVTLGGDGAVMKVDGEIYQHPGFEIIVEDTVGSGDAFLAGLLSAFSNKMPPQDSLAFACAIGALVTSKKGAWPEYKVEEISTLREK